MPYCHGRGVFFQDSCASIKTKPATCTKFGHSDVDLRQIACTSRFRPPTPLLKLESIAHGWHDIEPFNILSPGEKCIKLQKRTEITQSNQEHNDCMQVNTSKGCPPHPMTQPFTDSAQSTFPNSRQYYCYKVKYECFSIQISVLLLTQLAIANSFQRTRYCTKFA